MRISYLQVPLKEDGKYVDTKLKDAMWMTAEPLYKSIDIDFKQLHRMVTSDYRQYSPFEYANNQKLSENWNNDNQDLLIFDIDDGLTIAEAKAVFAKHTYLICTTKSHQQDKKGKVCDRFRVIMPSKNIPRGDDYFKFMGEIELAFPFIDPQVNNKTGAFMGHAGCQYWYNDGKDFDCSSYLEIVRAREAIQKYTTKNVMKEYAETDAEFDSIKHILTRERVADVVMSLGYKVDRTFKFKFREDERTPSASIRQDGYIKDFGGHFAGDVVDFIQEVRGLNFKEAVKYLKGAV